jgi:hypothetical protein
MTKKISYISCCFLGCFRIFEQMVLFIKKKSLTSIKFKFSACQILIQEQSSFNFETLSRATTEIFNSYLSLNLCLKDTIEKFHNTSYSPD